MEYLASQTKGATEFFQVKNNNGQLEIAHNTKAFSQRIAALGATFMLTNHPDLDRAKILELYRRKDYLEKTFDVLKNEFDGKRLRGHSKDAINGRLFIKFISFSPVPYEKHCQVGRCRGLLAPLVSSNNLEIVSNARRKALLASSLSGTRLNS